MKNENLTHRVIVLNKHYIEDRKKCWMFGIQAKSKDIIKVYNFFGPTRIKIYSHDGEGQGMLDTPDPVRSQKLSNIWLR